MRRRPWLRRAFAAVLVACTAGAGCNSILGIGDPILSTEGNDGGEAADGVRTDTTVDTDAAREDGAADALALDAVTDAVTDVSEPCDGNVDSSKQHCGACGHSCLGGDCVSGRC